MRPFTLSLLAIAAAGTAACGPVNRSVESVHQPVVSRADYVFDVASAGLLDGQAPEARRVAAWFDSLDLGYGDTVTIDDPQPYGTAREAIAAVLAERGLLLSGDAPPTEGAIAPGNIRVVVSRSTASVPGCPDWSRYSAPEFEASSMSNYGCSTNANLAMMVANPADLVRGQSDQADAHSVNRAVRVWRERKPTGTDSALKSESTGGK